MGNHQNTFEEPGHRTLNHTQLLDILQDLSSNITSYFYWDPLGLYEPLRISKHSKVSLLGS